MTHDVLWFLFFRLILWRGLYCGDSYMVTRSENLEIGVQHMTNSLRSLLEYDIWGQHISNLWMTQLTPYNMPSASTSHWSTNGRTAPLSPWFAWVLLGNKMVSQVDDSGSIILEKEYLILPYLQRLCVIWDGIYSSTSMSVDVSIVSSFTRNGSTMIWRSSRLLVEAQWHCALADFADWTWPIYGHMQSPSCSRAFTANHELSCQIILSTIPCVYQ